MEERRPANVLSVYGTTHIGKIRESNEDTFAVCDVREGTPLTPTELSLFSGAAHGVLFMVCDGMGGAAAGEVAARLACETVCRNLAEQVSATPEPNLALAMVAANEAIFEESRRRPEERGMGTTSTAALVRNGRLIVAQIGDSRGYLFRGGKLYQLTRDQSLAMAMVDSGALAPTDLKHFRHGNVILQALGVEAKVAPVMTELTLEPQDTVLLCSDGLHGFVTEQVISYVLNSAEHLSDRALRLIQAALDAGAPDNVTVVLARWNR